MEETDHRHWELLRTGAERQHHRNASKQRNEMAPSHVTPAECGLRNS
jgi:hypothetical protein